MQELVDFLIEERYCNSELEAIKILESVSDGFYEYLVNESSDFASLNSRKIALQRELKNPKTSPERSSAIHQELAKIGREMRTQDNIGAVRNQITGRRPQQTPRGPGGRSAQKKKDVISKAGSLSGVLKQSNVDLTRQADRLLGQRDGGEVPRAGGSSQPTGERVQRMYDPKVSGGRGTGTTRTGGKTPSSNG